MSQTTYQPLMTEWPPTASSLAVARGAVVNSAGGGTGKGIMPSSHRVHGMGDGTDVKFVEMMSESGISAVKIEERSSPSTQQQHDEGTNQQMSLAHDHEQDMRSDSHPHV